MKDKIKGKGSVGVAIAYYALRGKISIPLEPCEYNLIFDDQNGIFRVKVISCSYKTKYGIYSASVKVSGGNQPNTEVKTFDKNTCDIVFIVTDELDLYEIPADSIESGRQISLNKYIEYKTDLIPR